MIGGCWSTRLLAVVVAGGGLVASTGPGAQGRPVLAGLDHIPIAVADLDAAAARYRDLGFSLKPGRPHANGIRNVHAKFPDGTELELITAPAATDALTAKYRKHLAGGDGPAFLAFYADDRGLVSQRLGAVKQVHAFVPPYVNGLDGELSYIFVGPRNHSPTDRPEHFAHANTAESFIGVWLAAETLNRERAFLDTLGATFSDATVHVPEPVGAQVAGLPEGHVVLLPGSRQVVPGRRIVGATLRVRSLDAASAVLERQPFGRRLVRVTDARSASVFIPPGEAHGLWIELREIFRSPTR
ncbi:MAG TPA: VOC family protein [Vicinamibacterales bacterium]|nr:VOC family protein [Vicinamibacterales bacterium]